jgi:FHS family L-fucose permease-like MFS transporter
VVFAWALLMMATKFPKIAGEGASAGEDKGRLRELFQYPHFLKAVLAQFFYVGAQVGTWSYLIQYVQQYTGQAEKVAGYTLVGTLSVFLIARFAATGIMKYVEPRVLMGNYAVANVLLVAIAVAAPGWAGAGALFLSSFFMSLMFPTIFALGLKGLGPNTKLGGSMIVMAIVGGSVFPPLMGKISDATKSMAVAMLVPLACYVFVAYYGFIGSRVRVPARTA